MKRMLCLLLLAAYTLSFNGCSAYKESTQIAATTLPVFTFTTALCQGTGITVSQLVTESVSCLHDYTLQVKQMRMIESAQIIVLSGAGLEDFLSDALIDCGAVTVDASAGIALICGDSDHEYSKHAGHEHHHSEDPHIWLSPANARIMVENIYSALILQYPENITVFSQNRENLLEQISKLEVYGKETLKDLSCREIVTFHDGFAYLADAYELTILEAIEEESGSEASASELIHLAELVRSHNLPAIFTEKNGSDAAASIISAETGVNFFPLDMGLSENSYFDAMYYNIDTIKEALE